MIARWFRSLKTEEIYPNEYNSLRELRQAIRSYIETYNTLRPHSALGNLTPARIFHHSTSSPADLDSPALAG